MRRGRRGQGAAGLPETSQSTESCSRCVGPRGLGVQAAPWQMWKPGLRHGEPLALGLAAAERRSRGWSVRPSAVTASVPEHSPGGFW